MERYRRRMPYLVPCSREVMDGLSRLRASGWKVAIVTSGTAYNQFGKSNRPGWLMPSTLTPFLVSRA